MIYLGLDTEAKRTAIQEYRVKHDIRRVYVFAPERHAVQVSDAEHIEYAQIIEYKYFYRLLQEIDAHCLIVLNECLRTQNRYDLTYNCIRHYLNQTRHQLIFQYLPIIDQPDDFMTLFDWDTRSRWKREKLSVELLRHATIMIEPVTFQYDAIRIPVDERTSTAYEMEKQRLFASIGLKDPHTIPRNLYLMSGKAKAKWAGSAANSLFDQRRQYVGRNNRVHVTALTTYRTAVPSQDPYTIFEFPHNFIDFSDFASTTRQSHFDVLTADLKVDQWYLQRYRDWNDRVQDAYSKIS